MTSTYTRNMKAFRIIHQRSDEERFHLPVYLTCVYGLKIFHRCKHRKPNAAHKHSRFLL